MESKKKTPLWKRSCIEGLNTYAIKSQLYDIAEIEWEYRNNSRSEEFQVFFSDVSARAQRILEIMSDYSLNEDEICKGWDDFIVVLLGGTYRVLGYDEEEQDYYSLFGRGFGNWGEELAIKEAKERLMRLSKSELIDRWHIVLTVLTAYTDLKAAYDGLTAAMDFLENDGMKKSEELTADIEHAYKSLWYYHGDGRTIDDKMLPVFEAALEKTYPEMWVI